MKLVDRGSLLLNREFVNQWSEVEQSETGALIRRLANVNSVTVKSGGGRRPWVLEGDWQDVLNTYSNLQYIEACVQKGEVCEQFLKKRTALVSASKKRSSISQSISEIRVSEFRNKNEISSDVTVEHPNGQYENEDALSTTAIHTSGTKLSAGAEDSPNVDVEDNNDTATLYKCDHCRFSTSTGKLLQFHINRRHKEKRFKCEMCGSNFYYKCEMRRHMEKIHDVQAAIDDDYEEMACVKNEETNENAEKEQKSPNRNEIANHCSITTMRPLSSNKNEGVKTRCSPHLSRSNVKQGNEAKCFQCDICHNFFTWRFELRNHMQRIHRKVHSASNQYTMNKVSSVSKNNKYQCKQCNFKTWNILSIKSHMKREHLKTKFICNRVSCKAGFSCRTQLHKHIWKVHVENKSESLTGEQIKEESDFKCEHCDFATGTRKLLEGHIRRRHREKRFYCQMCSTGYFYQCELQKHLTLSHDIHTTKNNLESGIQSNSCDEPVLKFKCEKCDFVAKSKAMLSTHYTRLHKEKQFKCNSCNKEFSYMYQLHRHALTQHNTSVYVCKHCAKACENAHDLTVHQASHTKHDTYPCDVCGKVFSSRTNMQQHARCMHQGKTRKKYGPHKFLCGFCGQEFNSKAQVQYHENKHTGSTPYVCKLCSAAFANASSLRNHMYCHNEERNFICKQCGKGYRTKGVMLAHERYTHGEKRHKCEICDKGFSRSFDRDEHQRKHSEDRPYACEVCGNRFKDIKHLRRHVENIHKIVWQSRRRPGSRLLYVNDDVTNGTATAAILGPTHTDSSAIPYTDNPVIPESYDEISRMSNKFPNQHYEAAVAAATQVAGLTPGININDSPFVQQATSQGSDHLNTVSLPSPADLNNMPGITQFLYINQDPTMLYTNH